MPALPKTPRWSIERLVGNVHVGTPDAEVYRKYLDMGIDVAKRAAAGKIGEGQYKGLSEKQQLRFAKNSADYAVKVHQKNRGLYVDVMRGRVGRKSRLVPL